MLRDHVHTTWTTKGEGVIKTTLLNNCYLVKVSTKRVWEWGSKNLRKFDFNKMHLMYLT